MRRPLELIFIIMATGMVVEFFVQFSSFFLLSIFIFIFAISMYTKSRCFLVLIVGIMLMHIQLASFENLDGMLGKDITMKGVAWSVEKSQSNYGQMKYLFTLKTKEGDKIQVNYYGDEDIRNFTGHQVQVYGILEKPTERRNPHCFSYKQYLNSCDISHTMKAENLTLKKDDMNFYQSFINKLVTFRDDFILETEKAIGKENATVLKGMMFGIKDNMDDETYEEFQKNGTAHILATSGLHIGIIYSFLTKCFRIKRKILPSFMVIIFFICYGAMADFNTSVMRALTMITVSIGGKLIHRRYDLLSGLYLSAIILTLLNPMILFNAGFQMSFLAVFIMAVILPKLANVPLNGYVKNTLMPVMAIQLFMMPYIAFQFNYASLSSFFANIPVTALATALLPLGMITMVFFPFTEVIVDIFAAFLSKGIEMMVKINEYTYADGILTFDIVSPPIFILLGLYLLFFMATNEEVIVMYIRKEKAKIAKLAVVPIILISAVSIWLKTPFDEADVIFVDVGQGSSVLFKSDNDKTILIDGGGSPNYDIGVKTLKPMLLKNGIDKIDIAIVTHLDNDHYLGIKSLASSGMIKQLALYEGNKVIENKILEECNLEKSELLYLKRNDRVNVSENFYIDVIAPFGKRMEEYKAEYEEGEENNRSLVMNVNFENKKFLITGDIDVQREEQLVGNIKTDVLQVPHHGSKGSSSDELINRSKPEIAVFQVGKNNYGHPAVEVIEKYRHFGIMTVRNDLHGAIGFIIDNGKMDMIKMIEDKE